LLHILQRTGGVHPPEDRRGSFSRGQEGFILQRTGGVVHSPEDRRGSSSRGQERFILQREGGVHSPEDKRGSSSRGQEGFILHCCGVPIIEFVVFCALFCGPFVLFIVVVLSVLPFVRFLSTSLVCSKFSSLATNSENLVKYI
jgi:hypothetical protein